MKNIIQIHWPIIFGLTIILYILIIITLPFNEIKATIYLFTLIALWSRLPSIGIHNPGNVLYAVDLVDFFAFILAINIGGFQAGNFQAFANLTSRSAGITPRWASIIKDVVAQYIACLLTPLIYSLTNQDIILSMVWYSCIRFFMFIPMRFIEPTPRPWPDFIARLATVQVSTVIVNIFYAKYLGFYFDSLLEHGVNFSWSLFLIATLIIILCKSILFKTKTLKVLSWKHWIKLIINRLEKRKKQEKERDKILDSIPEDEELLLEITQII